MNREEVQREIDDNIKQYKKRVGLEDKENTNEDDLNDSTEFDPQKKARLRKSTRPELMVRLT